MQNRSEKVTVAVLSAGHFINDCYSNLLSPLLPPLIAKLGFTLGQAGLLGGIYIFASSLVQPGFGYLGDRHVRRAFALYGPLLTVICMSLLGLAPSYGWLLLLLIVGGAGVAAFHPQGAALVSQASTGRRSFGMSVFVSAGSLGYALGPTLISTMILAVGLERSYWAAVPGLAVGLLLIRVCPRDLSSIRERQADSTGDSLQSVRKPLAVLTALVILRSAVQFGVSQFLPLYFTERGYSLQGATLFLSMFLLAGGFGGFLGGHMAARYGSRRIIAYSMLFSSPLLLGFLLLPGIWSIVSLGLAGMVLLCTLPINVVLAQQLAPHRASTVSALTMGFAWGLGGLVFVPITGFIAEHMGLDIAYLFLVVLPLAGYFLSHMIPDDVRESRMPIAVSSLTAEEGVTS